MALTPRATTARNAAETAYAAALDELQTQVAEIQQVAEHYQGQLALDRAAMAAGGRRAIDWGHIGDLKRNIALLRQVTDAHFKRGEWAEG